MSSSEKVFSGGRSNFSQTCSLLSQYLKENGSFGDLTLGLTPTSAADPKGTMDLLPKIEKHGQTPAAGNLSWQMNLLPQLAAGGEENLSGSTETGPMTIFYAGQVMVFNDFPADKAKEIMMLARKSSANAHSSAFAPPVTAPSPAESATGSPNIFSAFTMQDRARHHPPQPPLCSDLPIARKNSLARFLEKRKDRITAKGPYQASKPAAEAPKPIEGEAWPGVGPLLPFQVQRHYS